MIGERGGGAPRGVLQPHGVVVAVVVGIVVGLMMPFLVRDKGEALTGAFWMLTSPVGLLIVLILLLLVIHFLSSDKGSVVSGILSTGEPDSIHRLSGSPIGVGLFLILIIFLLYYRFSIFRSKDDSGE